MPTPEEYAVETWTYAGRRSLVGGALGYLWIRPDGAEWASKKLKGSAVGAHYEVWVKDDSVLIPARYVSDGYRDPLAPEWSLEDRAAFTAKQAKLNESRATQHDSMGELTLAQFRAQLGVGASRTAKVAQLLRYLGAA